MCFPFHLRPQPQPQSCRCFVLAGPLPAFAAESAPELAPELESIGSRFRRHGEGASTDLGTTCCVVVVVVVVFIIGGRGLGSWFMRCCATKSWIDWMEQKTKY